MRRTVTLVTLLVLFATLAYGAEVSHFRTGPVKTFAPEVDANANLITFSNGFTIDTRVGEPDLPDRLRISNDGQPSGYYIIQFAGPLRQHWLKRLERLDVNCFGYLPRYAVIAKLTPEQHAAVQALPDVNWVGVFQPAYKLEEPLLRVTGIPRVVILVTPGENADAVTARIKDVDGVVHSVNTTEFATTIEASFNALHIADVARLPEVLWMQLWSEPKLANNHGQWVIQTGWRASAPPDNDTIARRVWQKGVRGQRIVLGVTDTGVNVYGPGHPAFRDSTVVYTAPAIQPNHRKVICYKLHQTPTDISTWAETYYHGSHVCGSVCGDDAYYGGTSFYDGMSLKAKLYFVDVERGGGLIVANDLTSCWDTVFASRGLPDTLRCMQQSSSWRWYNTSGTYLLQDASTDHYMWKRKDCLNLIAAGNEGPTVRSIGNPGIAKNVVTVGALMNGTSSNAIASFSSRGPTQDNRVKPTICDPGNAIYSCQQSPNLGYTSMSGTSMATPMMNGAIGLLRCYLKEGFYPSGIATVADTFGYISAALLRSMAIASAEPNIGSYVIPSFDVGWGRISVDSVLYFAGDRRKLILKDDTVGLQTGQYVEEPFMVTDSLVPLRVALVWTDTAALANANPTLVNNLNLELVGPTGTTYRGNQYTGGASTPNPALWDSVNVEECARINRPAQGLWTLRVRANQVRTLRQPYAYSISGDVISNLTDVGVKSLLMPYGTIDSTTITPACTVYNFGSTTQSYTVRMKIGSLYEDSLPVINHASRTGIYLTFPPTYNLPRGGPYAVTCSTGLDIDQIPANNAIHTDITVQVRDVACTRLMAPVSGTLDSGAVTTPACTIFNFGSVAANLQVRLRIGTRYEDSIIVTGLAPLTAQELFFADWTALERGDLVVACSVEYAEDRNNANDRQGADIFMRVLDAEAAALLDIPSTLDSGDVVNPRVFLRNRGNVESFFDVFLTVDDGYTQTITDTMAAGEEETLAFPAWTANLRGLRVIRCTTALTGDMVTANDWRSRNAYVRVHDVQAVEITNPTGAIPPGPLNPTATVRNNGTAREATRICFLIDATPPYFSSVTIGNGLPVGVDTTIRFSSWDASAGAFTAKCSVYLPTDQVYPNDVVTNDFVVGGSIDVAVIGVSPSGYASPGYVTPQATVQNLGTVAVNVPVVYWLTAGGIDLLCDTTVATAVGPGATATVAFDSIMLDTGAYTSKAKSLFRDPNPANDSMLGSFRVSNLQPGWWAKASVPAGPKGKNVKDGGCLAYKPDSTGDYIYALKGNGRCEFYRFNTLDNTWATLESIPAVGSSGKKKLVKKGAAMGAEPNYVPGKPTCGHVTVLKGANSLEFWRYDPRATGVYPWTQMPDVPMGARAVKEGAGLVRLAVNDSTVLGYLLKGSATTEFYCFNYQTNAWETKASAPVGTSGKPFKNGSTLAADGRGTLYATKGSFNEFFSYSIDSDRWTQLASVPLIGSAGRKKKMKDGAGLGCIGDYVYALKGGNTQEFYVYDRATNAWTQKEDIPLGGGRRVKGGGAVTSTGAVLYALKGNNTLEFYQYVPGAFAAQASSFKPQALAQAQAPGANYALRITPNPFSGTATISYSLPNPGNVSLKLYDVTGKLVTTLAEGYHPAGSSSFIVHRTALSSGIYLLKLETETSTATSKLIIE